MLVTLKGFGGKIPRLDAKVLPPSAAQIATNTKLWRGALQPFRQTWPVATPTKPGTIKTIYRFGRTQPETQYWFHWTSEVECVRGPVAGDAAERTYYTGDGVPKVTDTSIAVSGGGTNYPIVSYNLGVPKPSSACFAQRQGDFASGTDTAEARFYVYTFVSAWGEESKPSEPSNLVEAKIGNTVNLTGMSLPPAGPYNITAKRIYRAATGNNSSAYQLVDEIPAAQQTYSDAKQTAELGEVLTSLYYDVPDTAMVGLIALPNACLAGFVKNEVCLSEPGLPHAWPVKYRLTSEFDIVGLGNFGNSIVVTTTGNPYLITGVLPESMSMQKLELQHACVSRRSIVNAGDMVIYASPDGLVAVGATGAALITQGIMTRDDWQALKPSSISAYFHEGRYIAFYDTGTVQSGFVFDPVEKQFYDLGMYATAGFNDLQNDALYLMLGSNIVRWEGSSSVMSYTWRSKKFVTPKHTNFGAAVVHADSYNNLVVNFYTDGTLRYSKTVTNGEVFRLPSGFMSKNWEFELIGTDSVTEVHIATTVSELQAV